MQRRSLIKAMLAAPFGVAKASESPRPVDPISVDSLPKMKGELTLYLGRGEGGLYEQILDAIKQRNPALRLKIRRGPSTALANTIVAESRFGKPRADVFWAIDASSLGMVVGTTEPEVVSKDLTALLKPEYRYERWLPISGRIRTLVYNSQRLQRSSLPSDVMALAQTDHSFGWAPAYGAFQSFVTAMRLIEGEDRTGSWLESMRERSVDFAGELGVVMATSRAEVDVGFANHYYTLRLRQGKPESPIDLAFTANDAGCLLNTSGVAILKPSTLAEDFVRHLLTVEVQSYLAREAFELPLLDGVENPDGLPSLSELQPPRVDLEKLGDLKPTLSLLRRTGVL